VQLGVPTRRSDRQTSMREATVCRAVRGARKSQPATSTTQNPVRNRHRSGRDRNSPRKRGLSKRERASPESGSILRARAHEHTDELRIARRAGPLPESLRSLRGLRVSTWNERGRGPAIRCEPAAGARARPDGSAVRDERSQRPSLRSLFGSKRRSGGRRLITANSLTGDLGAEKFTARGSLCPIRRAKVTPQNAAAEPRTSRAACNTSGTMSATSAACVR